MSADRLAHARAVKATKLAAVLRRAGVRTGAAASELSDESWELAAETAGVRRASPETRALVVDLIDVTDADPFRGLPGCGQ